MQYTKNFFSRHHLFTILLIALSIYIYWNYTREYELVPIDKNDEFYVNDLYLSKGNIYKNVLNDDQKRAYKEIVKYAKKGATTGKIDLSKYDCKDFSTCNGIFEIANDAILIDHPELLNYSNFGTMYKNNILQLTFDKAVKFPIFEDIGKQKMKIMISDMRKATKDMTDAEKILYVYDWFAENTIYDKVFTGTSKNQSAYNVFINKNAVCAGFAKAANIIFFNLGIESYGVLGDLDGGAHMWNIVKYKDKYYYFDAVYAAGMKGRKDESGYYDGLKSTKLNHNHTERYQGWFPKVEEVDMDLGV